MYKLIDRQNTGAFSQKVFFSKEEVRQQLASYHSVDWSGVNDDDTPKDINTLSLDDLLDYGDWELEELTKEELVTEVHNTLSEISNDDEIMDFLEQGMNYFCSTWDKCEGYKHAILETLDDQNDNHFDELESDDLVKLLRIVTGLNSAEEVEQEHYCYKGEHKVYGNGNVDLLEDNRTICHDCKNK